MKRYILAPALFVLISSPSFAERAVQSDQLADSVGVNTHITYTDTAYASQWAKVLASLQGLHARHVRDGFYPWAPSSIYYKEHQQLKTAGIDCDYVIGTVPTAGQVATVKQLSGDMAFLEAQNEMDDQKGANWVSVLQSTLPSLYNVAEASQIPVIGPSLTYQKSYPALGDQASTMTYNNLHIYFGGRNPGNTGWGSSDAEGHAYGSIAWWLDNAKQDGPGLSSIVTETGYLANTVITPYTLPQNVEAKYAPRTILEMFNAGIVKSYFYELIDEVSSPGYGLLDANLNPKLAYTAVSNLLGLLQDQGSSFQPGVLNYTLNGASPTVHHLLLQKRDGAFYLALWIEAIGYNPATNVVTPVPTQAVQLTLDGQVAQTVYQMNDQGAIATTSAKNAAGLSLTLSDTVTIVQIAQPPASTNQAPSAPQQPIANGTYAITNQGSHFLLDDPGSSPTPGTQIIQWPADGGANQKWGLSFQAGYYRIENKSSGLYLTDPEAASSGTSQLEQESLGTSDAQLWSVTANDGGWVLHNKATGRVIGDPGSSTGKGTGIVINAAGAGASQSWTIQ